MASKNEIWNAKDLWLLRLSPFADRYRELVDAIHARLAKLSEAEIVQLIDDCEEAERDNCPSAVWGVSGIVQYEAQLWLDGLRKAA